MTTTPSRFLRHPSLGTFGNHLASAFGKIRDIGGRPRVGRVEQVAAAAVGDSGRPGGNVMHGLLKPELQLSDSQVDAWIVFARIEYRNVMTSLGRVSEVRSEVIE